MRPSCHPLFADSIRERLKMFRKKNVAVAFADQSLSDVAGSKCSYECLAVPPDLSQCPRPVDIAEYLLGKILAIPGGGIRSHRV